MINKRRRASNGAVVKQHWLAVQLHHLGYYAPVSGCTTAGANYVRPGRRVVAMMR
jgi:hypothetical protein